MIDETQAVSKIWELSHLYGGDFITFSGHKFKALQGIGGLIVQDKNKIK